MLSPLALAITLRTAVAADADHDGIPNPKDTCRDAAETANGWRDEDGCPDQLGQLRIRVLDLEGKAVAGARARVGEADAPTDAAGIVQFRDLRPEQLVPIAIEAPGYAVWTHPEAAIAEGEDEIVATLDWQPIEVHVVVQDTVAQAPLSGLVRADGPGYVPSEPTDHGEAVLRLRPGTWTLRIEAPQHQTATTTVTVARGAPPPTVWVALRPAWVAIGDLDLSFAPGVDTIGPERDAAFAKIAAAMFAFPDIRFEVVGRADPRPDPAAARAAAVRDALVAAGVDPSRITVAVGGPVATPWRPEGAAANRAATVTAGEAAWTVPFAPGATAVDPAAIAAIALAIPGTAPENVGIAASPAPVDVALAPIVVTGRADPSDDAAGLRRAEAGVAALIRRGVPAGRLIASQGAPGPGGLTIQPTTGGALPYELFFEPGTASLLPASAAWLPAVDARLHAWPDAVVLAVGHRVEGEDDALAMARAVAVSTALGGRPREVAAGAWAPPALPPDTQPSGYVSFVVAPPPAFILPEVGFGLGEIAPSAEVDKLAAVLQATPNLRVRLRGVAIPSDGPEPADLAAIRATAVAEALARRGLGPVAVDGVVGDGAPRVVAEVEAITLDGEIPFAAGSAVLGEEAEAALTRAWPWLIAAPNLAVEVVGRASGAEADLEALAHVRADAVAGWLVRHGVDAARLRVIGTRGTGTTVRLVADQRAGEAPAHAQ